MTSLSILDSLNLLIPLCFGRFSFLLTLTYFYCQTYSLKDIPGSVATASNQIIKPVTDATGVIIAQLMLPPKMIAEYILSSKPIQCLIPNVVVFEEISNIDIEMDELVGDGSDDETDRVEDANDQDKVDPIELKDAIKFANKKFQPGK